MAAPVRTALTTGSNKTTNSTVNSASITLSAGDMLVVLFAGDTQATSVTWNSLNLTKGSEYDYSGNVAVSQWYLKVTSGTSAVVTMNYSSADAKAWAISKITNVTRFVNPAVETYGSGVTSISWTASASNRRPDTIYFGGVGLEGPSGDTAGTWQNSWSGGQRSGTTGNPAAGNITVNEAYYVVSTLTSSTGSLSGFTARDAAIVGGYFDSGNEQSANAQASIRITVPVYAQSNSQIKTTYLAYGQAQTLIPITPTKVYAQAHAWIKTTYPKGGLSTIASDTFTRSASDWGTADIGGTWSENDGTGDYYYGTNGDTGFIKVSSANQTGSVILGLGSVSVKDVEITGNISADPSLDQCVPSIHIRGVHGYRFTIAIDSVGLTTGNLAIDYYTDTWHNLSSGNYGVSSESNIKYRILVINNSLYFKTWANGSSEPAEWGISTSDSTISSAGAVGLGALLQTGFSLGNKGVYFDNFLATMDTLQGPTFAQAQAKITSPKFAQAQAQIAVPIPSQYAQSQSLILTTYQSYAQSQAYIIVTCSVYAQTQGQIIIIGKSYAQALSLILVVKQSYAQSNSLIKTTSLSYAQAETNIIWRSRVYAQGRTWMLRSYTASANAQTILNMYTQIGQAYARIILSPSYYNASDTFTRTVSPGWGTADVGGDWTFISGSSYASTNGSQAIYSNNNAEVDVQLRNTVAITNKYYMELTYNLSSLPSMDCRILSLYDSGYPNGSGGVWAGLVISSTGAAWKHVGNESSSSGSIIAGITYVAGETWRLKIELYRNNNSPNMRIKTWKDGTSEPAWDTISLGLITSRLPTYFSFRINAPNTTLTIDDFTLNQFQQQYAQSTALIDSPIKQYFAQAETYIISFNVRRYANTKTQIKQIYSVFAQSQVQILAGDLVTYTAYAQSLADILSTSQVYAQSQTDIKQAYQAYSQGQAWISISSQSYAQSGGQIKSTYSIYAQSQAQIKSIYLNYGQAQTQIKSVYRVWAQSNVYIKVTGLQIVAQAQSTIKSTYQVYAQAASNIKQTYQQYAQGQGQIKTAYRVYAQVQSQIKIYSFSYAQSQSHIKTSNVGYAQAQAEITIVGATKNSFAQSNSLIGIATLYSFIDEVSPSDTDYIVSPFVVASSTARVLLTSATTPDWPIDHILRFRAVRTANSDAGVFTIHLYQDTTLIFEYNPDITTSFQTYEYRLSSAQIASITDYTTLVVEFEAQNGKALVSWVELQIPSGSGIKKNIKAYAQALSTILITTQTISQYGQAQGTILRTEQSYAQAQTYIKIANICAYAQSQAQIKQYYQEYGNAQAQIKQTYQVYAQALAQIKQVYLGYANAQGQIKTSYLSYAQAQALIKTSYNVYAQANSVIKTYSQVFAQANAKLNAFNIQVYAQALATIKAMYTVVAQAQAHIKSTVQVFAQALADIKTTYSVVAQAQTQVKQSYVVFANSQAQIKQSYQVVAQANSQISTSYQVYGQAQAQIKNSYLVSAQAQAKLNAFGTQQYAQAQTWLAGAVMVFAQAQAKINAFNVNAYAQAQALINQTSFVYAQAQAQIKATYTVYAQTQAQILQAYLVFANSQSQIKQTYTYSGQAQAIIISTYFGYAQAQSQILSTYLVYANAQGQIKQTYLVNAQAQSYIKVTNIQVYAQSQTQIKVSYLGFANAQAQITQASQTYAQAQARILAFNVQVYGQAAAWLAGQQMSYAQAQAHIKSITNSYANAQAQIKNTYQIYGQAQAQIKQTYDAYAQAQAQIKQSYPVWAQAQGQIKQQYQSVAQAQAMIKQTYQAYAQAQALVKSQGIAYGQALALVKTSYIVYAQANAHIKVTANNVYAQAQGAIKQTYSVYANAQGYIKGIVYEVAQANALIKTTVYEYGQAQGWVAGLQVMVAQAQASISGVSYQYGQAIAYIYIPQISRPIADLDNNGWMRVVI